MAEIRKRSGQSTLPVGHVHVWIVKLNDRHRADMFFRYLMVSERRVARSFRNDRAKLEYAASRSFLRLLASRYLGVHGRKVCLRKTATGRPFLTGPGGIEKLPLGISLSHCERGIAIAFFRQGGIGVDIEPINKKPAVMSAISKLLVSAESLDISPRETVDYWTRKEALLKGAGLGLSGLLSVPPLPQYKNLICWLGKSWLVNSLPVAEDLSVACAVEGVRRHVELFVVNINPYFPRRALV